MQNETPATATIIMKMTAKIPCKFVTFSSQRVIAPACPTALSDEAPPLHRRRSTDQRSRKLPEFQTTGRSRIAPLTPRSSDKDSDVEIAAAGSPDSFNSYDCWISERYGIPWCPPMWLRLCAIAKDASRQASDNLILRISAKPIQVSRHSVAPQRSKTRLIGTFKVPTVCPSETIISRLR